jgi:SAM-dependent methyltransferase
MFFKSKLNPTVESPVESGFERYYDANWLELDNYFRIHRERFIQTFGFVRRHCSASAGKVLDVGGVGPISAYFKKYFGWSVESTGTDLRKPLAIDDDAFDLILCTETVEHIKDVESNEIRDLEAFNYSGVVSMLRELRRSLKQAGRLVITTPNANSYITLHKWLSGESLLMDPQHVREFSVADLKRVAAQCDLVEIAVSTIDSWSDFGGHVGELKKALHRFPDVASIERGDNIVAAFSR